MDIFSLSARLGLDKREYEEGVRDAKSSFTDLGNHVKDVAKSIAAAFAFKEAIAGIKSLASAAVSAYGEYEQLVGGVETLFGDSADKIQEYADAAFQTAGMSANQYMALATTFAASLIQGAEQKLSGVTRLTEEEADAQYEAVKTGLDNQLAAMKRAQEDQYNAVKAGLDKRYKALQKALSKQYQAASEAVQDEIEAYSKGLQAKQEALEAAQTKEYNALVKAINKRIAEVDKEYQNTLKRIDQERAARLGAIDDELKAIEEEAEAKERAARDEERANTRQRLEQAVQWAQTSAERINAQNKLNDYLEKIRVEDENDARKARVDELKEQREQVQEEAKTEEDAAKKKRDKKVKRIEKEGNKELEALKKSQQQQMRALQESNAQQLKQFQRAKQHQLQALQESNAAQLEAVSESNAAQLSNVKRGQQDQLDAMKNAQAKQLKQLKASLKAQQKAVASGAVVTAETQARAAEMADIAIRDMSDNANKMGTSMEAITNAYQGFSKQNFTMLDNLKLGYGGTRTEMERLLADAGKITGKTYSIDNLMDIYEAIHVIQTEMGISGTTAKEAAGTIQGSTASMKASWENLMIALGKGEGIDTAVNNLITSAETAVNNVLPVLRRLIPGIGQILVDIGARVVADLPGLLSQISPALGETAQKLFDILPGVFEKLEEVLGKAFEVVGTIWDNTVMPVFEAFMGYINDTIIPGVQDLWKTYGQPLVDKIVDFWDNHLKGIFESVGTWLGENLPGILDNVMPIVLGAVTGFVAMKTALDIASIVKNAMGAISKLGGVLDFVAANPALAIAAAIGALVGWLIYLYNTNEDFRNKVDEAWEVVKTTVVSVWENHLKPAFEAIGTFLTETLIPAFQTLWNDVIVPLGDYIGQQFVAAWESVKTFWDELQPGLTTLKDAFSEFYETVLKPIGEFLGGIFKDAWDGIISLLTGGEGTAEGAVKTMGGAFDSVYKTLLKPVSDFIAGSFSDAWANVQDILTSLISYLTSTFKGDWRKAWETIVGLFGRIFKRIINRVKEPINTVIGFLNDLIEKVQGALNTVIGGINNALHIAIPAKQIEVFGHVVGFPGWEWSPGLPEINWGRPIPELAKGGIVRPGRAAIFNEAGPELLRNIGGQAVVTPIKGAQPANSTTINIYQQPGENVEALAQRIEQIIARNERQRKAVYA